MPRMTQSVKTALAIAPAILFSACLADDPADEALVDQSVQTCPVSGTDINKSMVVTDPDILSLFTFQGVMDRVRTTGFAALGQTNTQIFQHWMSTFGNGPGGCADPSIDPNKYGLVCPRAPELKLASTDPFANGAAVTWKPVALFNRFDLTPSSVQSSYAAGGTCGEYRIVFAMNSTDPNVSGRAFIIFEAALPNPDVKAGASACLPVAKFWQGLTDDPDVKSRANKLFNFYFTDNTVPGFPAAVNAAHYGLAVGNNPFGPGQIRTNFFIDFAQWHLREFKPHAAGPLGSKQGLVIQHVTVKANPAEELFAGTHALSGDFQKNFDDAVAGLASANLNTVALSNDDAFNEFESISQGSQTTSAVLYRNHANQTIRDQIALRLQQLGSSLTVTNILDRASTQTCGGCHQLTNNRDIGGGQTWPPSGIFVHVGENSQLSPALTTQFLPHRKTVLETFINSHCIIIGPGPGPLPQPIPAVSGKTLGGGAVGAAN